MGKTLKVILVLCIGIALLDCGDGVSPIDRTPRELTVTEKRLVESYNAFGLNLFREIISNEEDKNVFISPTSVSMALGMTMNGAAGTTEEAMKSALEFSGLTMEEINQCYQSLIELLTELDPEVQFQIANSIWYRLGFPFETSFLGVCQQHFGAEVNELDFSRPDAASVINKWVEDNTNGKIKKIVDDPIDPFDVIFLINAIYFYASWTCQFDPSLTHDDWFTLPDSTETPCKMMQQPSPGEQCEFMHAINDQLEILDLPYGDKLFSMTILLPEEGVDIDSIIAELDQETWDQLIDSLEPHLGHLSMPRFEMEYEADLKKMLAALGMGIAFGGEADFSEMCRDCGIFISKVKHKTYAKVNEEGTEAAAVTSVTGTTGIGNEFVMRVDRPFVFVIRENHSGTILFIGKIIDPGFEQH